MRYFLTAMFGDELEDGPILTSPMGAALVYRDYDEACLAAKTLVQGGTVGSRPVKGVFVQKLVPTAVYTPLQELKMEPPKEDDDARQN